MKKLETLLNTLIAREWKPFNLEYITHIVHEDKKIVCRQNGKHWFSYSLRELVSLESGLWQFCMANGLQKGDLCERIEGNPHILGAGASYQSDRDYQYRLIQSSLVPEEELSQFLLDNIIITGNSK